MQDVFSKLGESLKSTIQVATEQTQKSVDQVGCRTELLNKRSELKRLYESLGEVQYKCHIEGTEGNDIDLNVLYTKITNIKDDIKTLENKLESIVNTQKSSFDSYKRKVKTTWDERTSEPKQEPFGQDDGIEILKVCPVCNTGNHEHAAYCIKCGNKFE